MDNIRPFLRWAGGKQWLTNTLLAISPKEIGRYYEPFLGGGSFFFAYQPKKSTLSDTNHRLIETYQAIRDFPKEVIASLGQWENNKEIYYKVRGNKYNNKADRAAQFIYLNKTCWNGLYRVNRKGEFNVPFSNNGRVVFDADQIKKVSEALKSTSLISDDFENALSTVKQGDFIYFDPPYTVSHSNNGFRQYNEHLFSWEDQKRLARVANNLLDIGCYIIISNAWHMPIVEMYKNFHSFEFSRHSILAANSANRKKVSEALIISPNLIYN